MDASVVLEHENGKGGSVNVIKTCQAALQSIIHVFVLHFYKPNPKYTCAHAVHPHVFVATLSLI